MGGYKTILPLILSLPKAVSSSKLFTSTTSAVKPFFGY
jgi:hypothetical protein